MIQNNSDIDIPLSLYIHIPWCVRKCPYCDFNSHVMKGGHNIVDIEEDYIDALLLDLKHDVEKFNLNRPIQTIFIGGGTPSLFSDKSISRLLDKANDIIAFADNIEITLEANPSTAEVHFLQGYQVAGVTRISLGIQSFNDDHLQKLGRIHDSKEAFRAIQHVERIGFEQWNIDLMYGLPSQSLQHAKEDINQVLSISPPHVSAYQLTLEPNTTFAIKPPKLPQEDTLDAIHDLYTDALNNQGYSHYEVSAHAKYADNYCRHNLNYWKFGDYIGIGAGAHGKISQYDNNGSLMITRSEKTPSPTMYLKASSDISFTRKTHQVLQKDRFFEYGLNAFRLKDGFDLHDFSQRTGLDKQDFLKFYEKTSRHNVFVINDNKVTPTTKGFDFSNEILEMVNS